jgi:hypothetical protein
MSLQLITTLEIMVVEQSKRRRWSMDEWRAVQARYTSSGLPLRTFCTREGINLSSFYRWRERCASAGEPPAQKAGRSVPAIRTQPPLPQTQGEFVDLGQLHSHRASVELRLDLGEGLLLTLVRS